jgi:hypothetical protein
LVEFSDDGKVWVKCKFLMVSKNNYYIVTDKDDKLYIGSGVLCMWACKYIRKIPKEEITISVTPEQKEKIKELGININ